jgi:HK97 family phage major capsid protein
MPNLVDMKELRNKIMNDATAIVQGAEITAEQRTKVSAMLADVDTLEADIAVAERLAAFEEQRSASVAQARPNPNSSVEDRSRDEREAFRQYIKTGEVRSILTTGATGAAIIPQAFAPEIVSAQKAWGGLYNVVKLWETENGAPMKTSLVNATGDLMSVGTEGTAPTEVDPTATSITISTDDVEGLVTVSLDELQDSAFDLESFLRDSLGAAYFRAISKAIATGTTSVGSIVTGYASTKVTTAAVGAVAYADLISAYGQLDPAYEAGASWVMNSSTRASLMGIVDDLGRPLFIPSPNAGAFDTLLGRPVVISQYHDSVAASKTPIQFGDFKQGYKLRVAKPGLSVIRIAGDFTHPGMVGFYARARVGGAVTDGGTHPIVNIFVKAS